MAFAPANAQRVLRQLGTRRIAGLSLPQLRAGIAAMQILLAAGKRPKLSQFWSLPEPDDEVLVMFRFAGRPIARLSRPQAQSTLRNLVRLSSQPGPIPKAKGTDVAMEEMVVSFDRR